MNRFDYIRPASVPEAVAARRIPGSAYLAAGTNLLDLMKGGAASPERVVDITRLPGLDRIEWLAGRRRALRRPRSQFRSRLRHALRTDFPIRRRSPAVGGVGAVAQRRDRGRQSPAARALRLFLSTSRAPATGVRPAPAATPAPARTASTPCSAGASTASPPILPTSACRWWHWMPLVEVEGPHGARDIADRRACIACPARHRSGKPHWRPATSIVAVRLPANAAPSRATRATSNLRERTSYAFAIVSAAARWRSRMERSARRASRLAASPPKPWRARARPRPAEGRTPDGNGLRTRRGAGARARRGHPATTPSRSNWRAASSCALAASHWKEHRQSCPRCRPHHSPPIPERSMSLETSQSTAHRRHGSNAGQPLTRRDGVLKVTGRATYRGRQLTPRACSMPSPPSAPSRAVSVTALDVEAAQAHPGVVEVLTPANRPPLVHDPDEKMPPFGFRVEVLQNDGVRYANQPIALVIAETLEAATEGARASQPQLPSRDRTYRAGTGRALRPCRGRCRCAPRTSHRRHRGQALRLRARRRRLSTSRQRSTTTRWSRMRWSPRGTATTG